jgi:hypothetical protein
LIGEETSGVEGRRHLQAEQVTNEEGSACVGVVRGREMTKTREQFFALRVRKSLELYLEGKQTKNRVIGTIETVGLRKETLKEIFEHLQTDGAPERLKEVYEHCEKEEWI